MLKLKLNNLKNINKKSKKLGRGSSSKKGDKCTKGNKGQKSRSGFSIKFFEGGQTQFYKILPKYGFKRNQKKKYKFFYNINNIYTILTLNFTPTFKLYDFYTNLNGFFFINEKGKQF